MAKTYNHVVQQKLDHVFKVSKELVYDHGIPQRELYLAITTHLTSHAMDTRQVLYNKCHGGFSFSAQFCDFIGNVAPKREGMYDQVVRFGKQIAATYPQIGEMVKHYVMSDIVEKYRITTDYRRLNSRITYLNKNQDILIEFRNKSPDNHNMFLKHDKSLLCSRLTYTYIDVNDDVTHTPHKTMHTVDDLIAEIETQVVHMKGELVKMEPLIDFKILENINYKFPKESKLRYFDDHYSFLDAIDKYGENNHRIWYHQQLVDDKVMKQMLLLPPPPYGDNVNDTAYTLLGLLGASGECAALDFAEVPVGMSWSIQEYDGSEIVVVD